MQKYFAISPAETQCNEEYEFNLFERRKEARWLAHVVEWGQSWVLAFPG